MLKSWKSPTKGRTWASMKAPAVRYSFVRSLAPRPGGFLFVVHRLQAVRGDELVFSETDASTVAFPDAHEGMSDEEVQVPHRGNAGVLRLAEHLECIAQVSSN